MFLTQTGAAGIAAALHRRATEGGSYQVRVSLTRMCMWAHEVGLLDSSALDGARPFADIAKDQDLPVKNIASPFGEITSVPADATAAMKAFEDLCNQHATATGEVKSAVM